jgi:hypothetical protein
VARGGNRRRLFSGRRGPGSPTKEGWWGSDAAPAPMVTQLDQRTDMPMSVHRLYVVGRCRRAVPIVEGAS